MTPSPADEARRALREARERRLRDEGIATATGATALRTAGIRDAFALVATADLVFTPEHAAQLRAQVAPPTPGRYWLLLEEGDEVLDWRQARDYYAGCWQTVLPGGDHSFTRFPEYIPQLIEYAFPG